MRIVTLTPNPAWDVTHHVASLTLGESHRVSSVAARAGGKGINVARTLLGLFGPSVDLGVLPAGMREDFEFSQENCEIHLVAPIGGHIGELLRADLATVRGVQTHLVPVSGATRQSIAVLAADGSHPTLFNEPGAPMSAAEWESLCEATLRLLQLGTVLTISGSLPPGPGTDGRPGLTELVRAAHERGAVVLVDVSGGALRAARASGADVIKPNREEFLEAAPDGVPAQFAPTSLVVVTDGSKGMSAYVPGATQPVSAVLSGMTVSGNPTGAGDAALAALAWFTAGWVGSGASLSELSPEGAGQMLSLAVAVSAAAVREPVAGSVNVASVAEFFAAGALKVSL